MTCLTAKSFAAVRKTQHIGLGGNQITTLPPASFPLTVRHPFGSVVAKLDHQGEPAGR